MRIEVCWYSIASKVVIYGKLIEACIFQNIKLLESIKQIRKELR